MELKPVIAFLTSQKAALEDTIACLQRLQGIGASEESPVVAAPKKRGRKFMAPEDRQKVSARMKEYWEARRSQKTHAAGGGN